MVEKGGIGFVIVVLLIVACIIFGCLGMTEQGKDLLEDF
jgi:hypothetical protein